jgi:hypothetical protein
VVATRATLAAEVAALDSDENAMRRNVRVVDGVVLLVGVDL